MKNFCKASGRKNLREEELKKENEKEKNQNLTWTWSKFNMRIRENISKNSNYEWIKKANQKCEKVENFCRKSKTYRRLKRYKTRIHVNN